MEIRFWKLIVVIVGSLQGGGLGNSLKKLYSVRVGGRTVLCIYHSRPLYRVMSLSLSFCIITFARSLSIAKCLHKYRVLIVIVLFFSRMDSCDWKHHLRQCDHVQYHALFISLVDNYCVRMAPCKTGIFIRSRGGVRDTMDHIQESSRSDCFV